MSDTEHPDPAQDVRSLLTAIVESSEDAIIGKTLSGTITSWNRGAENIFGYPAAQAIGRPMLMVFPPEDAGDEDRILERIARGERVGSFETIRVRKDSKRIEVSVSISPISDSHGNIVGASTIARDITEQRTARDELARSASLLSIAGQMARLGGWSLELPAQTLTWSDEVCAIHEVPPGYKPTLEEAIAFYPSEHRDEIAQRVEACSRDGSPFDFELQIVTARGVRVWVRAMGEAVADSNGTILRVQGAFQDISERRRSEQALRESERELRALAESMPQMVWIASPDGCNVYFNQRWVDYTGLSLEESYGHGWSKPFHPEDQPRALNAWQQAVSGLEDYSVECRLRRCDGSYRWMLVRGLPFRDQEGAISKWMGTCTDIDDLKRAQQAAQASEREQRQLALQLEIERARLVAAQAVAKMGSWETDLSTFMVNWSTETHRIFGTSPENFRPTHQDFLRMVHPDDRASLDEVFQKSAQSNSFHAVEHRIVAADGLIKFVEERWRVLCDESGQAIRAVGTCQDISDRKQSEAILRQKDALLHTAGRVASIGGWSIKIPERQVYWSDEVFDLLEFPRGEVPPLDQALALYLEPGRDSIVEALETCAQDGTPFDLEVEILTARGRRIWVRVCGDAEPGMAGEIKWVQGAFQDVSERRRTEQVLRENEALFRAVVQNSWDVFHLVKPDGCIVYESPSVTRVLGYSPEEMVGRNALEFVHPDDIHKVVEGAPAAAGGQADMRTIVLRIRHKDGSWRWVESFEVNLVANPDVGAVSVNYRDITERRLAEDALRASAERFRLLSKATNDAIWDWDLESDALWWNEGFKILFGDQRDAVEPRSESWTSRIHPQSRERVVAGIRAVIDSGSENWTDTYQFRRLDGSYADVLDRGHVIRDASGRGVRMVGGMSDITERLALEERLRQSQRLDSIGQLTGGVAHDFNNLLTVILGNAELLTEQIGSDAAQRALADTILGAAQRGADLTQRLLAFARKQALDPKVTDVNRLVADLDSLLKRALGEHIEIEFVRGAGLLPALVDPAQLENALLNLCLNARDAMPRGGRLTIETRNAQIDEDYASKHDEVKAGPYVMLAVSDTGNGIAPDHLARVFEPFFTTKEKGKGTGLGLAMVYGFLKQSGGHASIYSELGHGTSVKLYLPRAADAAQDADPANADEPLTGGTETILMVEDDEFVRRFAQSQLRRLGYTVLTAENGKQALELLGAHDTIDLLFTDVVMPAMGGRELAALARQLRPGLRVLYTSGYTENAIVHHGRLDPGVLLLNKPYRRAELARKIREALAATQG